MDHTLLGICAKAIAYEVLLERGLRTVFTNGNEYEKKCYQLCTQTAKTLSTGGLGRLISEGKETKEYVSSLEIDDIASRYQSLDFLVARDAIGYKDKPFTELDQNQIMIVTAIFALYDATTIMLVKELEAVPKG